MHLWIDIDNAKHIPFFKVLINELKVRGHNVTVTAENALVIKKALKEYSLEAKFVGYTFSFFGLFLEQTGLFRAALLSGYIKEQNVETAFSFLGSLPLLYTCSSNKIPLILLLNNLDERLNPFYFVLKQCTFIVSENISDQKLIEKGLEPKKVERYKVLTQRDIHLEPKVIKEIVDKIELLNKHGSGDLIA